MALKTDLPDLDSLRCFVEAARLLNFRAAARAVGLTPAALGQRIRKLEDQFEVALFHRNTRRVVLTEHGMALLPMAQKTLDLARDCVRAAIGELGPAPMDIVLGTRHELGLSWILPMLPDLREAFPGVTMHCYFGSGPDLENRVRARTVDCAVSSRRSNDPKIDSFKLHEETYTFVASPRLLERIPFEGPADASNHTLVDAHGELPLFGYWRDSPDGLDTMRFDKLVHMGTIAAIRLLVLREDGVAVLPTYLVQPDLDAGRLVEVLPHIEATSDHFRLIFRTDDPRRAYFKALARRMRDAPLR